MDARDLMLPAESVEEVLTGATNQLLHDQSPSAASAASFSFSSSRASSVDNSDDEEDSDPNHLSYKDRRREAHTNAEQKRRDAIKKGYEELQSLVPMCQQGEGMVSPKLSKAAILQRSVDYIQRMNQQKKKSEEELATLRKEYMALRIMKANYDHIVKAHQTTPQVGQNQISDEVKFQVFQEIMDELFKSFNSSISVANFAELSGCVFSWLEEHCKPQTLRDLSANVLKQVYSQNSSGQ